MFLNAHSQAPSTLPSTWSFLLGLYPQPPPIEGMRVSLQIRDSDYTLADAFRKSGFSTAGFSENPFISPDTGFVKGNTDTLVELVDLYPTFVELFGLETNNSLHGRSLVPDLFGREAPDDRYLIAQNTYVSQLAVRKNDLKAIFGLSLDRTTFTPIGLYNIANDAYEQENLLEQGVAFEDLYAAGTQYIAKWIIGEPNSSTPAKVPQERLDELQAIGYLQ